MQEVDTIQILKMSLNFGEPCSEFGVNYLHILGCYTQSGVLESKWHNFTVYRGRVQSTLCGFTYDLTTIS